MDWMVLVVAFAVFVLVGFVFVAYLIYADDVSERRRVVMCSMYVLLFAALVVFWAIKRGETIKDLSSVVKTATTDSPVATNEENKDPSSPVKTATEDSSIAVNEEDKPSPSVVEPNDTTEADAFVIENLRYELNLELRNPWVLARYLYQHDVLDEFGPNEGPSAEVAVNAAASLFLADDSIRERAYEKAVELFSDAILDTVWEEFKKANPQSAKFDTYEEYQAYLRNPAARPLARIAETGETISTEPADSWEGPFD